MSSENNVQALTTILSALEGLDKETQKRTLQAVITFLDIPLSTNDRGGQKSNDVTTGAIGTSSENRSMSPKEFLREKSPVTDIERIACLGFYLTHYRDTPHFKTMDLSNLNTEAAQPKLSNAAFAVVNATNAGYLVQANKGSKQLSAAGELFVQALPDRDAAKATMASMRVKRKGKKNNKNASTK
jgi:hypothetical protein